MAIKSTKAVIASVMLLLLIAGCGGPNADVTVFVMPARGISADDTKALQQSLERLAGETMSVEVYGSPIYNEQKLIVEFAAGEHGIYVLPQEQFRQFARNGAGTPLEDKYDPERYSGGMAEKVDTVMEDGEYKVVGSETHLYGLPANESIWFKDAEADFGEELYMIVVPREATKDKSLQLLDRMMGNADSNP